MDVGLHDGLSCQNHTLNAQTHKSHVYTQIYLCRYQSLAYVQHRFEDCHLTAEFTGLSDWPSIKKLQLSPYANLVCMCVCVCVGEGWILIFLKVHILPSIIDILLRQRA